MYENYIICLHKEGVNVNNGHRIVREDTYEKDEKNLEDYVSNMNDMRWNHQQIMIHYIILVFFDDESFYYHFL